MSLDEGKIKIRRITREDADWKRRVGEFYAGCPRPPRGAKQSHAYFAAYNGKDIVGHCEIYKKGDRFIMDGLRVKTEFRERGIAKALTRERISYAILNGAKEIWYSCDDNNLVTACCHMSFGFKKVCPSAHHCTPATTHWYKLKVTKELTAALGLDVK